MLTGHCFGVVVKVEAAEQDLKPIDGHSRRDAWHSQETVRRPVIPDEWKLVDPHGYDDANKQVHFRQCCVVPLVPCTWGVLGGI